MKLESINYIVSLRYWLIFFKCNKYNKFLFPSFFLFCVRIKKIDFYNYNKLIKKATIHI
jgi:hypothetical protein